MLRHCPTLFGVCSMHPQGHWRCCPACPSQATWSMLITWPSAVEHFALVTSPAGLWHIPVPACHRRQIKEGREVQDHPILSCNPSSLGHPTWLSPSTFPFVATPQFHRVPPRPQRHRKEGGGQHRATLTTLHPAETPTVTCSHHTCMSVAVHPASAPAFAPDDMHLGA